MSEKFTAKILRSLIVFLMFVPLFSVKGIDLREAQHSILFLGTIIAFGFVLRNVWLTAFLAWSVALFSYYKFQIGGLYVYNILIGCIFYYLTRISFKKEHISLILNAFLWLVVANLGLMVLQMLGYDFIYKVVFRTKDGIKGFVDMADPCGFMALKACMGIVMALAVPIMLSKWTIWHKIGTVLLFVPIYLSKSSICVAGAIAGLMFVIWHKDLSFKAFGVYFKNRTTWILILFSILICGLIYVVKVDAPMGMLPTRLGQWQTTLKDCIIHPISGWGLDSFRNETTWKPFLYAMNVSQNSTGGMTADYWDNAHNLYIQTFFEWGLLGLVILVGYIRGCFLKFSKSIKTQNTVALGGFFVCLLIINIAQFPMFLARTACFIIPIMAVFETQMEG